MGLIQAALGSATGVLQEQWREYFACEALPNTILMKRGHKVVNGRASNNGNDNVISNGSKIIVYDGQGIITTDNGRVVDVVTEPGGYEFTNSSQPSIFLDKNIGENLKKIVMETWDRFKYAGQPSNEQRVFFFNTKQIQGIPFGTPSAQQISLLAYKGDPVPTTVSVQFHGKVDIRIVNPLLFYKEITGNAEQYDMNTFISANRERIVTGIVGAMKSLGTAGELLATSIEDTEVVGKLVDDRLSPDWTNQYGLDIIAVNFGAVNIPKEEKALITRAQEVARYGVQGKAMLNASERDGNMMGAMMGVGFGQQVNQGIAGGVVQGQGGVKCPNCGAMNQKGKFCNECGSKLTADTWKCECGTENTGKFCSNCGKQKPEV